MSEALVITDLPEEILEKILHNLSYDEIASKRIVCKRFNCISKGILNRESQSLISYIEKHMNDIKTTLPRQESAREAHPRFKHFEVLRIMHLYVKSLIRTYSSYIEDNTCCFIAGKVMDEAITTLNFIKVTDRLTKSAYSYNNELCQIADMAEEHFNEVIGPSLKNALVDDVKVGRTHDLKGRLYKKSNCNSSRSSSSASITTEKLSSQSIRKIHYRIKRNKVAVLCVKGQLSKMRSILHKQTQKLNKLTKRLESAERKLNQPIREIKKQDLLDICEKLFPHIKLV